MKEKTKLELIKRYRYLYLNSEIILSGMVSVKNNKEELFYDNKNYSQLLLQFLLSDISYEETSFYNKLEILKYQEAFLKKVSQNIAYLKEEKAGPNSNFWHLLTIVRNYLIENNVANLKRCQELETLDEYFRINRTTSNKTYTSGFHLEFEDIENSTFRYLNSNCRVRPEYRIIKKDNEKSSEFVNFFAKTNQEKSLKPHLTFTIKELEKIYLSLHDILPKNISIICENIPDDLERPLFISSCNNTFFLSEEEIFTDLKGNYYQMCPKCGNIIKLEENLLSELIEERIINKVKNNPNILSQVFLVSEITNIEYRSKSPTRILKNNYLKSK